MPGQGLTADVAGTATITRTGEDIREKGKGDKGLGEAAIIGRKLIQIM
jgi:hypothetical protein